MDNIERNDFFPTCVYKFQHEFVENELEKMLKHINDNSWFVRNGERVKRTGSQTQDELHKTDTFSNITNTIIKVSRYILDDQEYMGDIEITNMWGNILRAKEQRAHRPHAHSNNFLSGVFYLKTSPQTTPIQFFDPRPQASVLKPRKSADNNINSNISEFYSQTGLGVMFPAWLQHWVPETLDERISIAWNVLVRGEHGEPHTLQNAII